MRKERLNLNKEKDKPLSPYGRFHLTYLGYNFRNLRTGIIYKKGTFWDEFREIAEILPFRIEHPIIPIGFELINFDYNVYNRFSVKIKPEELPKMYSKLIELRKKKYGL